jgi:hypothetical protein
MPHPVGTAAGLAAKLSTIKLSIGSPALAR